MPSIARGYPAQAELGRDFLHRRDIGKLGFDRASLRVAQARETLDRRYDDLRSGRVKPQADNFA